MNWVDELGSNVERVKRRRVRKMRRAQMEIVDWALERIWLEFVRLRSVLTVVIVLVLFLLLLLMLLFLLLIMAACSSSSSGKNTKKKPIPQPSVLFLPFAINPISHTNTHRGSLSLSLNLNC